jgi:hypothetical protein
MAEAAAAVAQDPAAANPDAKGLIDDAKPVVDPVKPEDQDGAPGAHLAKDPTAEAQAAELAKRERPGFLPEKFWDPEKKEARLADMAKSYAELEKNFKLGKHKAPMDGKYSMDVFGSEVPESDPLRQAYVEWATKYGLSQGAFDELAGKVKELRASQEQEFQVSYKAERAALGQNADAIITSMTDWARGFVRSGVWSLEDFEEFKIMGGTAAGMRALMKLRESYEGRIPLRDTVPSSDAPSREELDAMVGDPRYVSDAAFRAKVTAGFEKLYGTGAVP